MDQPAAEGPDGPQDARPSRQPALLSVLPEPVRVATAWSAAELTAAGALTLLLVLAWVFRAAAIPVVIAVLVTALLEPLARRIVRTGRSRPFGAGAACVLLVGAVGGTLWLVVRALIDTAASLKSSLAKVGERLGDGSFADTVQGAASGLSQLGGHLAGVLAAGALHGLTLAAQLVTCAVLTLAVTFFLLRDVDRIPEAIRSLTPPKHAELTVRTVRSAYEATSAFMRGTTLIALIDAATILVGLLVLRVHGAFGLAALVFIGAYVPFVGAFLSGMVAVLVALGDRGLGTALWTFGIVLLVQFIEGNFLQPAIQSHTVSLHPALVMLAVTAGASVGGILGALLAVPVAAATVAALSELRSAFRARPHRPS